ncbi:MAG: peptide MFS transporter [Dysgonomonas sp.]
MFKNHPKGLLAASLSNMGERFGFYIMMAILTLFLMSKFGLDETNAALIYSIFYFCIYGFALIGGLIADKTKKYKNTILVGIALMAVGYLLIAIPTPTPVPNKALYLALTCVGLFVIAFGNGLFKGNLQALVGQMYDNETYSSKRDSGFSLFYMFINVGAIFAPLIAVGVRNWMLKSHGYAYEAGLTSLCHQHLEGTISAEQTTRYLELIPKATLGTPTTDLTAFANDYLSVFNTGFHYAFAVAIFAMLISLTIYIINKKGFPDPALKKVALNDTTTEVPTMDKNEIKQRLYALFAVFGVVIFFWFSFHQNGVTLTYFANDFTNLSKMEINLFGLVTLKGAELFQMFNPLFVVLLTPIVLSVFGWLKAKGKEPSAPRKIAIGMGIAAIAYVVMSVGSLGLPTKAEADAMGSLSDAAKVTPFLLIGTYFILTIAELFISPLGISFVSKVAPPQYQGIMQGCWLGATALGNQLLFIGAIFYKSIPIWATWLVFVVACCISMFTMLFMIKWLERITK